MNCSINDHRETRLIVMSLIFPSFFHHTYIHFTFLLIQQSRRNLISYLTHTLIHYTWIFFNIQCLLFIL